jgi:tetratricopeptide (TPR) repeat protein
MALLVRSETPGGDLSAAAHALFSLFEAPGAEDGAARVVLANALDQLGKLALARGDLPTADACFTAAIAAAPRLARPRVNRAAVRAARRDYPGALADTEAALELAPDHVTALINAARFHIQLGHDGDARRRIDRARSLAPGRAAPWAITAILDARAGNLPLARSHTDRALALDPNDRDAVAADKQLRRAGH